MHKICVIIPAYNEELSIGRVVEDISRELVDEVIVVSNNSTDNTELVAGNAGATVLQEHRKGYGWACLKGMDYIREKGGCDIVVFMDGDYADDANEMQMLLSPIQDDGCKMVIGSRVLGIRQKGSLTPQQIFGNWLATRLIRLFYGAKFTDLGPYRAINWEALQELGMSDKTYGWTIEMQIKVAKKGMDFKEVAVSYRKRIGVSKVSGTIKGTVMAGIKIIFAVFKYRF